MLMPVRGCGRVLSLRNFKGKCKIRILKSLENLNTVL
jgi:hypothetical protein